MPKTKSLEVNDTVTITDSMGMTATATVVALVAPRKVRVQWGEVGREQWMTLPASKVTPVMKLDAEGNVAQ